MKYEYKIADGQDYLKDALKEEEETRDLVYSYTAIDTETGLEIMQKHGWELVSIFALATSMSGSERRFYFRRKTASEEPIEEKFSFGDGQRIAKAISNVERISADSEDEAESLTLAELSARIKSINKNALIARQMLKEVIQ
jgi:hypothetical protein